jgi:hypothetical protein
MENIRKIVSERRMNMRNVRLHDMREELLPADRLEAIQEELAGFLLKDVINPKGAYHYR